MSELRVNKITGESVIIADERASRPFSLHKGDICQFCPENEHLTPSHVYKSDDDRVRIFENKYPIVRPIQTECVSGKEIYGYHEVIVDTNIHEQRMHQFEANDICSVFKGVKNRISYFESDKSIKYIQVFKNEKERAGASIDHSHWQLVALSYVPQKQKIVFDNLKKFYENNKICYYCDLLTKIKDVTIMETEYYVAYCPHESKFGHEVNIIPKRHVSDFNKFMDNELDDLSKILKLVLKALSHIYSDLAYNICMYNTAFNNSSYLYDDIFHYSLQIIPRAGMIAGFEFSTNCYINSIYPEKAAQTFRDIIGE